LFFSISFPEVPSFLLEMSKIYLCLLFSHLIQKVFFISFTFLMSRDSAVGIATAYGLNDQEVGIQIPEGPRIFSSPRRPDWHWGLPSPYTMGARGFFPGVKRPGREADHSPPIIAEVKKIWMYTSIPQ
jgi:hypothetical protein